MTWTIWIAIGSISGAISVLLGAFGAHALKERLSPEYLAVFDTAVRYQMFHALALLAVGFLMLRIDNVAARLAGGAFLSGTLLFSGSLYALVATEIRALGMITPVGGVAFVIGWLALAWAAVFP